MEFLPLAPYPTPRFGRISVQFTFTSLLYVYRIENRTRKTNFYNVLIESHKNPTCTSKSPHFVWDLDVGISIFSHLKIEISQNPTKKSPHCGIKKSHKSPPHTRTHLYSQGRKQGPNGPVTHPYQFLLSLGVFPENLSSIGALLLFGAPRDLELPQVTLKGPGRAQCGSKGALTHSNQFLQSWSVFPQSLSQIGGKIAPSSNFGPQKGRAPPKNWCWGCYAPPPDQKF